MTTQTLEETRKARLPIIGEIVEIKNEDVPCITYVYQSFPSANWISLHYIGRSKKSKGYRHATKEQALSYAHEWTANTVRCYAQKIKANQAKKTFVNPLKAGDIVYSSWGYDQTNIDYYQVIESKGMFVVIREVAKDSRNVGWCSEMVMPRKGDFVGPELRKKVGCYCYGSGVEPYIRISSCQSAGPWDGTEKNATSYA